MQLKELLQTINTKKQQLDKYRPLSTQQIKNLKNIYDIDLTYNSNAIEGSTLTYSETKLANSHQKCNKVTSKIY